jgi:uracil-DNA glycosylase
LKISIDSSWESVLGTEFAKPYFQKLAAFVKTEYASGAVYPEKKNIFKAFNATPFDKVRVVILGQDPYHGPYQANGLSFSVPNGIKIPPSLHNIFKEIKSDLGSISVLDGDLTPWAKQGVLLLNSTLTVRDGEAGSHQKQGWETFTDEIISKINQKKEGVVFLLWGSYAQKKGKIINESKHLILRSVHPSPLSSYRGFFGCKHFSITNKYLKEKGSESILW